MDEFNWEELLEEIIDQKAVLLLGHGFFPDMYQSFAANLKERLKEKILHNYEKEGLFMFADLVSKSRAQRAAKSFFRGYEPNHEILEKIVEIPFPLIVSTNPDKSLSKEFEKYNIDYQFDFFTSRYKEQKHVEEEIEKEVSIDHPLIYNLFGSAEDPESLILDYDDLFNMLKSLLSGLGVSDTFQHQLNKNTTTYVFIGFHFERWYTQLLLRYLNMNKSRFENKNINYVLKTTFSNEDAQNFFLQQFNVKLIGADWSFFDELHQRFSEKYPEELRTINTESSPVDPKLKVKAQVKLAIERAMHEEAFQIIDENISLFELEDQQEITILKMNFRNYLRDKSRGVKREDELEIKLNVITDNMLNLIERL